MRDVHDRVARLVVANTPEQLARAYLKARARAEAAERKLEEKNVANPERDTREGPAFSILPSMRTPNWAISCDRWETS